jgi:thymidylate synthase (FAD)
MILVKPSFEFRTEIDGPAVLRSIEAAGRTCNKSEDAITDSSASDFVRKIIKRGHESVIEHESVSVKFIVDRGVSHELVRHRLCAFSQESTRYCNYGGGVTFVIPPWVTVEPGEYEGPQDGPAYEDISKTVGSVTWFNAMLLAEEGYQRLCNRGWTLQQARSVLPNSLKTEIVMTCNLKQWHHIFTMRCNKAAHPQMREVMIPLRKVFMLHLPELFPAEMEDA